MTKIRKLIIKSVIFLLIFSIFSIFVCAEYDNIGYDYNFNVPLRNKFYLNDSISFYYTLSEPYSNPLSLDINKDGMKELVVLSDDNILFLHFNQTEILSDFSIWKSVNLTEQEGGYSYYSNIEGYDIDKDGYKEIIVHGQISKKVYIVGWNGSDLILEKVWGGVGGESCYTGNCLLTADSILGCGHSEGCILAYNNLHRGISTGNYFSYLFTFDHVFNRTDTYYTMGAGSIAGVMCYPNMGYITYSDVNDRYYFTAQAYEFPPRLYEVALNSTHTSYDYAYGSSSCEEHIYQGCQTEERGIYTITSPTPLDYTEEEIGEEIVYACQVDSDEFKGYIFDSSLSEKLHFPLLQDAKGVIKSNPIAMTAFNRNNPGSRLPGTELNDVCIVGYENSESLLNIICASTETGSTFFNVEFYYYLDEADFNISSDQMIYSQLAHSVESDYNNGIDEVLTPYGILELQDYVNDKSGTTCLLSAVCQADMLYRMPLQEASAVISDDMDNTGFADILAITDNGVVYVDDKFRNSQAYIGYCTDIRPCLSETWLYNGSSQVAVVAEDIDGDNVRARAIWFYGLEGGEAVIDRLSVFPDTYIPINSTYVSGYLSYLDTVDGINYVIREQDNAPYPDRLAFDLVFNVSDCNKKANLSVYSNWKGEGELEVFVKNQFSGTYDKLVNEVNNITGWTNNTIIASDNFRDMGYILNDALIIRFTDKYIWEYDDDDFEIDYINLECNADTVINYTIDSGWSGWFSAGTIISLPRVDNIKPIGQDFVLRIMVQDVEHNSSYYYRDYYYDVNTAEQGGFGYLSCSTCVGLTEEEYVQETEGVECETDSDCDNGEVCNINNVCESLPSDCESDSDCPDGWICSGEDCLKLPTEEDNVIKETVNFFSAFSGVPVLILILLLQLFIGYFIFTFHGIGGSAKIGIFVLFSFFVFSASVVLGLINFVWILIYIIISLAVGVVFFAKSFKGGE